MFYVYYFLFLYCVKEVKKTQLKKHYSLRSSRRYAVATQMLSMSEPCVKACVDMTEAIPINAEKLLLL